MGFGCLKRGLLGVLGSEEIKGRQYISVYVMFSFVFVDACWKLNRPCRGLVVKVFTFWSDGSLGIKSFHLKLCNLDDGSEKNVIVWNLNCISWGVLLIRCLC